MTGDTLVLAIRATISTANLAMYLCWIGRNCFASGTRGRYVWATLAWACVPVGALDVPSQIIADAILQKDRPGWMYAISVAADVFVVWDLWRHDDDNYWRRTRKRAARWLRDRLAARKPVTAGATA